MGNRPVHHSEVQQAFGLDPFNKSKQQQQPQPQQQATAEPAAEPPPPQQDEIPIDRSVLFNPPNMPRAEHIWVAYGPLQRYHRQHRQEQQQKKKSAAVPYKQYAKESYLYYKLQLEELAIKRRAAKFLMDGEYNARPDEYEALAEQQYAVRVLHIICACVLLLFQVVMRFFPFVILCVQLELRSGCTHVYSPAIYQQLYQQQPLLAGLFKRCCSDRASAANIWNLFYQYSPCSRKITSYLQIISAANVAYVYLLAADRLCLLYVQLTLWHVVCVL